jgi:hypothetical protein
MLVRLQKILAHAGHQGDAGLRARMQRLLGTAARSVRPNALDAAYVQEHAEHLEVLPPIFKTENTRWGDPWDERYSTPEPLLKSVQRPYEQVFLDEARDYTWMTYLRLKL